MEGENPDSGGRSPLICVSKAPGSSESLLIRIPTADAETRRHQLELQMQKNPVLIENILVDEAHQRTYVVMAERTLTDGELYSAIRIELLRRGSRLADGERLVIGNTEIRSGGRNNASLPAEME